MRRLIAAVLSVALLLPIIGVAPVAAACAPGVYGVQLYESNGLAGDSRLFCGSVSDLRAYVHTQEGNCVSTNGAGNTWNNCANSFRIWMPADRCLIFFNGWNYTLAFETIDGPQTGAGYQFGFLDTDTASSFKFYTSECSDI